VAKFRGDWSRELGDYALKKKEKHHEHFISPPVTPYGRPNNKWSLCLQFVVLEGEKANISAEDDAGPIPNENWQDGRNRLGLKTPPKSIISVISGSDDPFMKPRLIKSFLFALLKAAAAEGNLYLLLISLLQNNRPQPCSGYSAEHGRIFWGGGGNFGT